MFQFPGFALLTEYYTFNIVGCPIRIFADQFVCANPHDFSQLITSFFASESLGIPHTPLSSLYAFCSNAHSYNQNYIPIIRCILMYLLFDISIYNSFLVFFVSLNMSMNVANRHRYVFYQRFFAANLLRFTSQGIALWRISESNR